MKSFNRSLAAMSLILISFLSNGQTPAAQPIKAQPKIQVAILLDVSGSMAGLIEQAKAQLWNMVTILGKAQCSDKTQPKVELALYEYGRSTNDVNKGYVKQLSSFTNDLDEVSKILFSLNTNGGDEYCGQVIWNSIDELKWDASPDSYKVIFISGNEDFLQGSLHYTKACTNANSKGVIVNTIYCGSYEMGIKEHWSLVGECGNGSYSNIDHNAKDEDIPTPYDSVLLVMNNKLNNTYIGYGAMGGANASRQQAVDQMNFSVSTKVAAKRMEAKAQSNVYSNAGWDLVDAIRADSTYFTKLDKNTLPDSLKNKSTKELQEYVKEKTAEREAIQKDILMVNANRSKYIMDEKAKNAVFNNNQQTLETVIERSVKEQAARVKMIIQ